MTTPRVVGDELLATVLAAIALFAGLTYAMLDDVPAGTSRAGDFFGSHDSRLTCPSFFFSNMSFETRPRNEEDNRTSQQLAIRANK
jgi:hypothetical protein